MGWRFLLNVVTEPEDDYHHVRDDRSPTERLGDDLRMEKLEQRLRPTGELRRKQAIRLCSIAEHAMRELPRAAGKKFPNDDELIAFADALYESLEQFHAGDAEDIDLDITKAENDLMRAKAWLQSRLTPSLHRKLIKLLG